ncbi:MAG: FAD-dependent oxidoreductase [Luteitalea sp.]|nr:FAD-dependent oxidoreductase [Luteitalea sp.]
MPALLRGAARPPPRDQSRTACALTAFLHQVRLRRFFMTITPIEHVDADVAVIGSGFAGALVSLALTRRGRRVALVERGRHPRFAIGESSTPLANLLLEELADRYDLRRIRPFSKWGTWQRERPEVAGGVKRGFTFLFHRPGEPFADDGEHRCQLLVAASPRDEVADTHWYRPDFDQALACDAEAEGAVYLDETRLERMRNKGDRAVLDGTRNGRSIRISARFVVDASGPRGFLHRAIGLADPPLRWLPRTQGLYAHFEDVGRWDEMMPPDGAPPYPPDAAALHHVFPGGWIWVLRFNNGITSAGAALTDRVAQAVGAGDGAAAWERLLKTLPSVGDQFREARVVHPFVHAPRVAFRTHVMWGDKWAMLPSAAGVIDPLLSTGFPLTLLGIGRLLDVLEGTSGGSERDTALAAYARVTELELDATEQLVAALYANMSDVPLFKRLSLLYFAAASFSEAARRLGRPELAPGFLLHAHPRFGPELRACAALATASPHGRGHDALLGRIDRAIEPFDTAGLLDRTRRDWYPVLADDLLSSASKLDSSVEEIHRLLECCGLVSSAATKMSLPDRF